ncbi:MAG: hypothetical protein A2339_06240 [Elusimicrobia bacterium RIFOXYB12_FULL_50_12]|nr:MAG: hypothetical protein A2278_04490 [Elusimicrobia bacterium RIFOXYA12_FULL_49_49]OGS10469.1 MAG: hypothetical protein A2386_05175 [Elusimicrobia bacterium RIFOXYB1_FULL_48_9]OGS14692.1 MAG: hypothetical protein A2251_09350 [Elusimicrobia bacterium RIFOXYA2_FULL_47_53]OGS25656.1 MAG: hypothetical protein A2339_06240 [Elusimicrobia bacterium RIFOXYB12_FULL_50_12]OGS31783.1 MAG: hypothetical protein A2323_06260 [Elusimicrobia bacterium RIFOXYB2_FULL_46_23]
MKLKALTRTISGLALPLAAGVVFLFSTPLFAAGKTIEAVNDGKIVAGIKIYDYSGDAHFALKQVARLYGAKMVWHPITGKASLLRNNRKLDIYIKSSKYIMDGKKHRLNIPSRFASGEVFVPVELLLAENFADFTESDTSWNHESQILNIEPRRNILSPRFYSKEDKTQIIIELAENLKYDISSKKPGKIVVSFPRGRVAEESIGIDDGVVKQISCKNDGRMALAVISLTEAAGRPETIFIANPPKLIIEIPRTGLADKLSLKEPPPAIVKAEKKEAALKPEPSSVEEVKHSSVPALSQEEAAAPAKEAVSAPEAVTPAEVKQPESQRVVSIRSRKPVLVLDAGHGGDDPGAVGRNGTKEKDVNLQIVLELGKLFRESGKYDIYLTRQDDTFIPLVDRTNIANEKMADMFISIHCNASMNKNSGGFEVYFLNENASDSEAAATAVLENSVVNLEKRPNKKQQKLQMLLWSLVVNEFINESSELCCFIAEDVTKRIKIENRGVKQAGFYVLRGAQMPAVLVECAFISHAGEESKLKSRNFQRKIADSIFTAVNKYEARKDEKNSAKRCVTGE